MADTLWTHSLEAQRRLLLSSVAELLKLETQLRRQRLPVSLEELNQRLLLISRLVPATLWRESWPAGLRQQAQDLSIRILDLALQSRHAPLGAPPSVPDATGTSVV